MFDLRFKVLDDDFAAIYQPIGKCEIFYAYKKDDYLVYEIIDGLFGQPSPANWDTSDYAVLMRNKSEKILQRLIDEGKIELLED